MPAYTAKVLAIVEDRADSDSRQPPLTAFASFDLTIRSDGEQALEAICGAASLREPFAFVVLEGASASAPLIDQILSAGPEIIVIACVAPRAHPDLFALAERSDRLLVMSALPEGRIDGLLRSLLRPRMPKHAPRQGGGQLSAIPSSDGPVASDLERGSERLRARETELAAGIEMLKATFDNMRQGFLLLDDEWRVKNFNSRLNELVGYPPGVMRTGATAYDVVAPAPSRSATITVAASKRPMSFGGDGSPIAARAITSAAWRTGGRLKLAMRLSARAAGSSPTRTSRRG